MNDILLTGAELTGTSKLILLSSSEHRIQSYDPTVVEVFAPRALLISTGNMTVLIRQSTPYRLTVEVCAPPPVRCLFIIVSLSEP